MEKKTSRLITADLNGINIVYIHICRDIYIYKIPDVERECKSLH